MDPRHLAIIAIADDMARRHVLGCLLGAVAEREGCTSGYSHKHGETQFVDRLASMGLITSTSTDTMVTRHRRREWRLTDTGREVVCVLLAKHALCVDVLLDGTAAFVWRKAIEAAKGAA